MNSTRKIRITRYFYLGVRISSGSIFFFVLKETGPKPLDPDPKPCNSQPIPITIIIETRLVSCIMMVTKNMFRTYEVKSTSNKMPWTDIALYVRINFWLTIKYKYHEWNKISSLGNISLSNFDISSMVPPPAPFYVCCQNFTRLNKSAYKGWYLRIPCTRVEWTRWFDLFKAFVYIDGSHKYIRIYDGSSRFEIIFKKT